jgi:hypothetical protein
MCSPTPSPSVSRGASAISACPPLRLVSLEVGRFFVRAEEERSDEQSGERALTGAFAQICADMRSRLGALQGIGRRLFYMFMLKGTIVMWRVD